MIVTDDMSVAQEWLGGLQQTHNRCSPILVKSRLKWDLLNAIFGHFTWLILNYGCFEKKRAIFLPPSPSFFNFFILYYQSYSWRVKFDEEKALYIE